MKDDRKYQKQHYKQTHTEMGVYQIKNQQNGKIFMGSSMDLRGIFNRHKFELKFNNHKNRALQNDWNKHGHEMFSFDVLEKIKPEEEIVTELTELRKYQQKLEKMKEKWFEILKPYEEKGYHKNSKL
ncbi:GIY-YIG nuclease family protein [Bacillus spongiae]|uniref:GIY-YIG nuclease family protein n=1 Tax=Bacillus spongiae TaxID=2683610 RepID=A0ABU8HKP7_9BACI